MLLTCAESPFVATPSAVPPQPPPVGRAGYDDALNDTPTGSVPYGDGHYVYDLSDEQE